jgi:hypothetical protein
MIVSVLKIRHRSVQNTWHVIEKKVIHFPTLWRFSFQTTEDYSMVHCRKEFEFHWALLVET